MIITRKHPFTGQTFSKNLPITEEELDRWNKGELIQNVWPHLSADDREYILTGICDWDSYIPEYIGEHLDDDSKIKSALENPEDKIADSLDLLVSPDPEGVPVATLKRLIKYSAKGYFCGDAAEDFCREINGKTFDQLSFRHYID